MDGKTTHIEQVRVELDARSYDILIGPALIERAGELIAARLTPPRAYIVSDENVAPLYAERVAASLAAAGIDNQTIILPAGEATKSWEPFENLVEELLSRGVERATALVALGGGVIGDITGFAASVLLRGIPFVQIPTTLLAQVDSSVGGKTAINSRTGKNLVGTFYQPRLVIADTAALATLPPRELRAGYAEIVKHGLLGDAGFFAWLEQNGSRLLAGDSAAQIHAVKISCLMKAAIVGADEREQGKRALLNLGHTFGHALEAETGFGDTLLHGEAVAVGLVLAFELSAHLGLCAAADTQRVRDHLAATGLADGMPAHPGSGWQAARLIELMGTDKKVVHGKPSFVLAHGIGDAFVARDIETEDVAAVLNAAIAA